MFGCCDDMADDLMKANARIRELEKKLAEANETIELLRSDVRWARMANVDVSYSHQRPNY